GSGHRSARSRRSRGRTARAAGARPLARRRGYERTGYAVAGARAKGRVSPRRISARLLLVVVTDELGRELIAVQLFHTDRWRSRPRSSEAASERRRSLTRRILPSGLRNLRGVPARRSPAPPACRPGGAARSGARARRA